MYFIRYTTDTGGNGTLIEAFPYSSSDNHYIRHLDDTVWANFNNSAKIKCKTFTSTVPDTTVLSTGISTKNFILSIAPSINMGIRIDAFEGVYYLVNLQAGTTITLRIVYMENSFFS